MDERGSHVPVPPQPNLASEERAFGVHIEGIHGMASMNGRHPIVIQFESWWAYQDVTDSIQVASVVPFSVGRNGKPEIAYDYKVFRRARWPINQATNEMFRTISNLVHQELRLDDEPRIPPP